MNDERRGCPYHDPFKVKRKQGPVLKTQFDGEDITMILGMKEVRKAARDVKTYSSAAPFRVPIPSEENVRSIRQQPIEHDPPDHTDYRNIVAPFFNRPKQPDYVARIASLIDGLLTDAIAKDEIEIVRKFAIPLQCRALTYLCNVPEDLAETWIAWGTHIFRDEDGQPRGAEVEQHCKELFERAKRNPGDDIFSALNQADFQGRPLTLDEKLGFANLIFAGGRDTIINTVCQVIAYFAHHPEQLGSLHQDPRKLTLATEEFIRFATPLTHIGRVCPVETDVHGSQDSHVKAGGRISLAWASANFDETVFENPEEVKLDRMPNPHVAFGTGIHNCLGAPHARVIIRTLVKLLSEKVTSIDLLDFKEKVEREVDYERVNAYEMLKVTLRGAGLPGN